MRSPVSSPRSPKRIKLEDATGTDELPSTTKDEAGLERMDEAAGAGAHEGNEEEEDEERCSICLHRVVDRTVIPKCSHEFCFECLLVWTEQSRRCPLCSQTIGEYLIHSIRSRYDYRKHYLPPLRTSPPPVRSQNTEMLQTTRQNARRRRREREWGTREREHEEFDKLERSIAKRRWIYQHDLYAKHVASNAYTKYRPYPTPAQFAASQELISRTTTFLRRELQVWEGLDVEFLTNLIISLMKAIDIRSESAVKLISEFLDMDAPYEPGGRQTNAEHFAHEVYCYVRSPYRDLFVYDSVVQYDAPADAPPPPPNFERSRRWNPSHQALEGESSSQDVPVPHARSLRSRSRPSERDASWSPSGRHFPSNRDRGHINDPGLSRNGIVGESNQHRTKSHRQTFERKYAADESISERGEPCDKPSIAESSSKAGFASSSSETDRHMTLGIEDRSVKGKGTFKGEEPPTNLEPTVSESSWKYEDGQSEHDTPPVPTPVQSPAQLDNIIEGAQVISGGHPPNKALRVPRNRSLLDSVRAHLAGNIGPPLAGEKPSASFDQSPNAQEQGFLPQEATLQSNPQVNARLSNGKTPDAREGTNRGSDNVNTHFSGGIPPENVKAKATPQPLLPPFPRREAFGDTPPVTPAQVPRIGAPRTIRDAMIKAENSIADAISPIHDPISDGSRSASSSNTYTADELSRAAVKLEPSLENEEEISFVGAASKSKLGKPPSNGRRHRSRQDNYTSDKERQQTPIETQIPIHDHDAEQVPHVLTAPARDLISIRQSGHSNSVAGVFVTQDQSRPHATPNSVEARTRLLDRLEFEKKQARLLGHADGNSNVRADSDAAVLGPASMSSSSNAHSVKIDTLDIPSKNHSLPLGSERTLAASHAGDESPHNDPTHSSNLITEEAARQEARLRSRAQLRVRLAAEKRLVHGD